MASFPWEAAEHVASFLQNPADVLAFALSCADARRGVSNSTDSRVLRLAGVQAASTVIVTAARAAASRQTLATFVKAFDAIGVALRAGFTDVVDWACERQPGFHMRMDAAEVRRACAVGRIPPGRVIWYDMRRELMRAVERNSPLHVAELVTRPLPADLLAEVAASADERLADATRRLGERRSDMDAALARALDIGVDLGATYGADLGATSGADLNELDIFDAGFDPIKSMRHSRMKDEIDALADLLASDRRTHDDVRRVADLIRNPAPRPRWGSAASRRPSAPGT
jgi:hypothetical protein